jgi:DNA-binding MarR family transcriptional regulator
MSKKRPKSEREVDLPDWADDVTPAEEVMRKFYAPTGAFKPGPIAVLPPFNDAALTDTLPQGRTGEETRPEFTGEEESNNTRPASASEVALELKQPEAASDLQVSSQTEFSEFEESQTASLPASVTDIERAEIQDADRTEEVISSPATRPANESTVQAQPSSFEDFARKWNRYLYPGQLAVMRTLYEMTLDSDSTECFTQYSQIASATKMTRRNCINVMNSLVERGFVERLEVRNDATGKGIRLRIHPDPLP